MTELPAKILAEGKFLRLIAKGHWEYADRTQASGAVTIVAVTPENKLVLVEQYRIPLGRNAIELPAGLSGDIPGEEHEALQTAAERELLEETGYTAAEWQWLTGGPSSAGLSTELITFFLARGLTKVHAGGGDDHENIIVHEIPLAEVPAWLARRHAEHVAIDPKVYAGLYFAGDCRS
ncbi:MAG: NUDIX hydrolase [Pirellulales bacterium]|nr:NUDIX hydrolase [Pirellulales bacterium]